MRIRHYLNFIAFEHSIFALPFALSSFIFAQRSGPLAEKVPPTLVTAILVALCAVTARTAAMGFNRIVDLRFDRENTRTATRELVSGEVKPLSAWLLVVVSSLLFLAFCAALGMHCCVLAPFVLLYLFFYSFSKRFTYFSHLLLGGALALAPGGAWWVLRPQIEAVPLMLMASVAFWVCGFDILYSLQDEKFDRERGLFSVPVKLGAKNALVVARAAHFITFGLFIFVGLQMELPLAYFYGLVPIAALFIYQHRLVTPDDISRVNRAFFTINGWVSVYYLALVIFVTQLV